MIYQKIKSTLIEELKDKKLTDAHRHSLYDINQIANINGLSVEEWSKYDKFIQYQQKTKKLYGAKLQDEIKDWIKFSKKENISTIIDFSAKHASLDLKNIYKSYNIKNFYMLKWNKIETINQLNIPDFIILPDERLLNKGIISKLKELEKVYPQIKFTMHCLESKERKNVAFKKFGMSTIEWLNKNNFFDERFFLVHINEVSLDDIKLIKTNNVKIILCPLMRKPLNYNEPNIPLDLDIYFGTDTPLISNDRSLLKNAIHQAILWLDNNNNFEDVIKITVKALTKKI